MNIGFIGTGVMGASIVKHLLNAEHNVTIYIRTKEKAEPLVALGATWAHSPAEASIDQEVIFTMVGYPSDVEEVYCGENGIFSTAKEGAIVVDMTTSEPTLAKKLYDMAKEKGIDSVDAPVSGGDLGARNGTLSIMIGGDEEVVSRLQPLFETFGQNIVYQGQAGAGQHTKMCNQIAIASNMMGITEALVYGIKAGLNIDDMLKSIATGAAGSWSLSNLAPRVVKGDLAPGFYIKHFIKDMKIAIDEAERMQIELPGLRKAKELYNELLERGYGDYGTQALIKYYISEE